MASWPWKPAVEVQDDDTVELESSATWTTVVLWRCKRFPEALLHLVGLEGLLCNKCTFSSTPGIQKLINLRDLELVDCSQLTDVQPLVGLPKLQHLLVQDCEHLENFLAVQPGQLPVLQSLTVNDCKSIHTFAF
jgi:hypothetical protein